MKVTLYITKFNCLINYFKRNSSTSNEHALDKLYMTLYFKFIQQMASRIENFPTYKIFLFGLNLRTFMERWI